MDTASELDKKQLDYETLMEARRLMAERFQGASDDTQRQHLDRLTELCSRQKHDIEARKMLPG
jgi:hypothetical protein